VTLRSRLLVAFVAVVGVPLLVGLAVLASALPRAFADQQERSVLATGRLAAALVVAQCDRARAAAEAAGRAVLAVPAGDRARQEQALRSLVERGVADGLRVVDGAGRTTTAGDVPDRTGDCAAGNVGAGPVVAAARLQQDGATGAGKAVAVVAPVDEALAGLPGGAAVVAVTPGEPPDGVATALARAALAAPGQPVRASGSVAVAVPLREGSPAAVVVAERVEEGVDVVRAGLGIVLGAVLLAAGIAPLLARATTRPLEELGDAAARVAAGDLGTTIDVRTRDEVGVLAGAFNTMTDELRHHIGQLEAGRDELRAGLARLGETLGATHDLDRILDVVVETAVATSGARAGVVMLREGDVLRPSAARGVTDVARLPVGEGVAGRVARSGVLVHGRPVDLGASPAEPSADAVVALPLRGAGAVLGVLVLLDPRGGPAPSPDDVATLTTLAGQAGLAVENVLRHRDVQRLAVTDELTGLANYRSFLQTVDREVDRAARYGRPMSLLLLDVDHFKAVNDTFGHQRGDAVLAELAQRVRAQVRDVDTVARYGGEEVVVVLPETDADGAELAAERIRQAVRSRPFADADGTGDPVRVTVSLGVAVHEPGSGSADALLRRADEALYAAKRAGRDTWRAAPSAPSPAV
jgi:two-component system, cell cycle response regulator